MWKLGSPSAPQKPADTADAAATADGVGDGDDSRPLSPRAPLERLRDRHPQLPDAYLRAALEALGDADRVTQQLQVSAAVPPSATTATAAVATTRSPHQPIRRSPLPRSRLAMHVTCMPYAYHTRAIRIPGTLAVRPHPPVPLFPTAG